MARSSVAGLCLGAGSRDVRMRGLDAPKPTPNPPGSSGNTLNCGFVPGRGRLPRRRGDQPRTAARSSAGRAVGRARVDRAAQLPAFRLEHGAACSSDVSCSFARRLHRSGQVRHIHTPSAHRGGSRRAGTAAAGRLQAIAAPAGLGGHAGCYGRLVREGGSVRRRRRLTTGPAGRAPRPGAPWPSTGTGAPGPSSQRRAPSPPLRCAACRARCRTLAPRSAIRRTSSRLPRLHSRCDGTGPRGSCSRRPPPATRYPPGSTECPARRSSCARPSAPPGQAPRLRLWSSAGATGSGRCSRSPSPTTGPSQLLGRLMPHANALLGRGRRALPARPEMTRHWPSGGVVRSGPSRPRSLPSDAVFGRLHAVSCPADTACTAVGYSGVQAHTRRTLALVRREVPSGSR